jgi:hypothetical protein
MEVSDSLQDANRALYEAGYTDGLPVIPPTPELVEAMYRPHELKGDQVLGRLAPRFGQARIDLIAANAVMAGCQPEHFPVIIAAVKAMLDESFNLLGVQATTHPCTIALVLSGPVRHSLGINLNGNAMGEGNLATATIGRAIRLIGRNIGGAMPGRTDLTAQGSPARFSFAFGENEELSPFPAFHTTRGFSDLDSVVTIFGCEGPHNVNDHSSNTGKSFLEMLAGTMATFGPNDLGRKRGHPLVALGVEHAGLLHRDGYTREQVQEYLFENARVLPSALPKEMREWLEARDDINRDLWNERGIPLASCPENFSILVAGGPGRHSCFMPSFAFTEPVSAQIELAKNIIVCDC